MAISGSIGEIILIEKLRPFKRRADTIISIMNEFFLLTVYLLFGVMHRCSMERATIIGWISLSLVAVFNTVNFILLLTLSIHHSKERCKKRRSTKVKKSAKEEKFPTLEFS